MTGRELLRWLRDHPYLLDEDIFFALGDEVYEVDQCLDYYIYEDECNLHGLFFPNYGQTILLTHWSNKFV